MMSYEEGLSLTSGGRKIKDKIHKERTLVVTLTLMRTPSLKFTVLSDASPTAQESRARQSGMLSSESDCLGLGSPPSPRGFLNCEGGRSFLSVPIPGPEWSPSFAFFAPRDPIPCGRLPEGQNTLHHVTPNIQLRESWRLVSHAHTLLPPVARVWWDRHPAPRGHRACSRPQQRRLRRHQIRRRQIRRSAQSSRDTSPSTRRLRRL